MFTPKDTILACCLIDIKGCQWCKWWVKTRDVYIRITTLIFLTGELIKYLIPYVNFTLSKENPSTKVKLLPCDHEVMGSSLENSLLQKCKARLRT
jgi:hypothetical protein